LQPVIDFTAMINSPNKVTLFVQCLVDGLYPEVGEAVVKIFRKLNIDVECPADQTCCGQPAFNAGDTGSNIGGITSNDISDLD
jgi:Fe-S oxidoreductase